MRNDWMYLNNARAETLKVKREAGRAPGKERRKDKGESRRRLKL